MLLSQFEAFVEVVRYGTLRQASEALHVSQPALSARISNLEEEAGARLFDRKKKGMVPTPVGQALLPHAERALAAARAGLASVRDVEHGRAGEMMIGATSAVSEYVLPEVIRRFRLAWPTVRVIVRTRLSEEIVGLVGRGDVQLGVIREQRVYQLIQRPIYVEEIVLVGHPIHPLAGEPAIDVESLSHSTLILLDRRWPSYEYTQEIFAAAGTVPHDVIEVDSVALAKQMVMTGQAVAFLPTTAVAKELADGNLIRMHLIGGRALMRRVTSVELPEGVRWTPLDQFRTLLRTIPTFVPGTLPVIQT